MEVLMLEPFASYFLVIIIHFSVGVKEDLRIFDPNQKPIESLAACEKAAENAINWLHQDFTNVEAKCVPVNKVS
jgi:hypothetical protein